MNFYMPLHRIYRNFPDTQIKAEAMNLCFNFIIVIKSQTSYNRKTHHYTDIFSAEKLSANQDGRGFATGTLPPFKNISRYTLPDI